MVKTKAFQKVSGVPNLYHRGGRYYARISTNGKQSWRSLGTTRVTVAKTELAKLQTGQPVDIKKRDEPTLHKAMEETLQFRRTRRGASRPLSEATLAYHGELLKLARRTLPDKRLSSLSTEAILSAIGVAEVGQSRRKALFELVKGAYRRAVDERQTLRNPLAGHTPGQVGRKNRQLPTREELDAIVAEVERQFPKGGKKAALSIRFLAFSGLRRGEALGLTWAHVRGGKLHVTEQENGRRLKTERSRREVQINPPLKSALDEIAAIYGREDRIMPSKCVRAHLKTACAALGFQKLTNHDLRSWFATWAIQSGVDVATVADWMGDSPEVVLRRYTAIMDDHKREAASKLR